MDSGPLESYVQAIRSLVTYTYISYAALTIVCAEHILTIGHEYNRLWKRKRKWNAATWLFLINRYVLLAATVTYAAPWNSKTCTNYVSQLVFAVFLILPSMVTAIFSALRIFALQEGRCLLPSIILFFGLIAVAFNTYFQIKTATKYVSHTADGPLCPVSPSLPNTMDAYGMLIGPVCLLIADFVAIAATWTKTYHHVRQAVSLGMSSVAKILLRDGSLYFIALFLLAAVQVFGIILPMFNFAQDALFFSKIMPNILLGRFLVNLRRFTDHEVLSVDQLSGPMHFASGRRGFHYTIVSIATPLGEPVDYGAECPCLNTEDNVVGTGLDEAEAERRC